MEASAVLQQRRTDAVPRGIFTKALFAARAENAELWDVDGRRYIDFAAGIAVVNTGHRHPKVVAAVEEQLRSFSHTCFNVAPYESYIRLAERLNALVPGEYPKKTMLASTGAEAVENAVKIARAYTGRSGVIAATSGFHGRTLMALALTGKIVPYKKGFGPFPGEVYHIPFPDAYRGGSATASLEALDRLFKSSIEPARVAAIIIEPVQGEGGFNVAPFEFLQGLRRVCDEHGILLIADEVQTGFGRTGKLFAVEHAGIAPDLMTMAKSLAGGFPLSAVTGRADVMDAAEPGGLGGTYAGNPLACAAANAVLDVIEEEGLAERAMMVGDRIKGRLARMSQRNAFACIGDIRGLGAMVAVELVEDRVSKKPAPGLTTALLGQAQAQGLVLLSCGPYANVVRFLPPLTIPEQVLEEGLDILEQSLEQVVGG